MIKLLVNIKTEMLPYWTKNTFIVTVDFFYCLSFVNVLQTLGFALARKVTSNKTYYLQDKSYCSCVIFYVLTLSFTVPSLRSIH